MSKTIAIHDGLSIETTRRCNMSCEHCLRGPAQNKDLNPDVLDSFFKHVTHIYNLTPTGGEPTLNPNALLQIKQAIQKYNVTLSTLYIVTNALQIPDEFIKNFMDLLLLTDESYEYSGITVSHDIYHDEINPYNEKKLEIFSCYRKKDKTVDWNKSYLINIGNARSIQNKIKRDICYDSCDYCTITDESIDISDMNLGLTVDGYLIPSCDYAYEDVPHIAICNVLNDNWVEELENYIKNAQS